MSETNILQSARDRAREEVSAEIVDVARRQLAAEGAGEVSVRAVAREMNIASSAVYRYFPSRDDLLNGIIHQGFIELARHVNAAEREVDRTDFAGRWMAIAYATWQWSSAHPQEHNLMFASPVPGYQTPLDKLNPSVVIPGLIMSIAQDAAEAGRTLPVSDVDIPRRVKIDLKSFRTLLGLSLGDQPLARSVLTWMTLVGCISFRLLGHARNAAHDTDGLFDFQMRLLGRDLGLT
jgi:AcrR family transcriptional regulator